MHAYFTFSFLFPLIKKTEDISRKCGFTYQHSGDIEVTARGFKLPPNPGSKAVQYNYEIEKTVVEGIDIYSDIEATNGLDQIKAACLHHLGQISYSRKNEVTLPYFPLKAAI